jgi:hypothetical protein
MDDDERDARSRTMVATYLKSNITYSMLQIASTLRAQRLEDEIVHRRAHGVGEDLTHV